MTPQVRAARRIATEIRQARSVLSVARARADTSGIANASSTIARLVTSIQAELTSSMSAETAAQGALSTAQSAVTSARSALSSAQSALTSALSTVGTAQASLQSALNTLLSSPDLGLALKVTAYVAQITGFDSAVSSFTSQYSSLTSAASSLGSALQTRLNSAVGVAIETAGVNTVQRIINDVV